MSEQQKRAALKSISKQINLLQRRVTLKKINLVDITSQYSRSVDEIPDRSGELKRYVPGKLRLITINIMYEEM